MIKITKHEKEFLVNNGCWFGENGISQTIGKHRSYYLCESPENLAKLYDYRKSVIKQNYM